MVITANRVGIRGTVTKKGKKRRKDMSFRDDYCRPFQSCRSGVASNGNEALNQSNFDEDGVGDGGSLDSETMQGRDGSDSEESGSTSVSVETTKVNDCDATCCSRVCFCGCI